MNLLILLLFLYGCSNEKTQIRTNTEHHVIHRQFESAGIALFHGLPFAKHVSYDDKCIVNDTLQTALDSGNAQQWRGKCSYGSIEIKQYFCENGFECCEFSVRIFTNNKEYVITNKAAKINVASNIDPNSHFWVLADTIENYKA